MAHKSKRKQRRFVYRPESQRQPETLSPQEFGLLLHQAERRVLPMIREMQIDAGGALLLLTRQAQALLAGHPFHSLESMVPFAERVLELWQGGFYIPDPAYPYTPSGEHPGPAKQPTICPRLCRVVSTFYSCNTKHFLLFRGNRLWTVQAPKNAPVANLAEY